MVGPAYRASARSPLARGMIAGPAVIARPARSRRRPARSIRLHDCPRASDGTAAHGARRAAAAGLRPHFDPGSTRPGATGRSGARSRPLSDHVRLARRPTGRSGASIAPFRPGSASPRRAWSIRGPYGAFSTSHSARPRCGGRSGVSTAPFRPPPLAPTHERSIRCAISAPFRPVRQSGPPVRPIGTASPTATATVLGPVPAQCVRRRVVPMVARDERLSGGSRRGACRAPAALLGCAIRWSRRSWRSRRLSRRLLSSAACPRRPAAGTPPPGSLPGRRISPAACPRPRRWRRRTAPPRACLRTPALRRRPRPRLPTPRASGRPAARRNRRARGG